MMAQPTSANGYASRAAGDGDLRRIDEYEAADPGPDTAAGRHHDLSLPNDHLIAVEKRNRKPNSEENSQLERRATEDEFAGIDEYEAPEPADDEEAARSESHGRSFLEDDRQRTNESRQTRQQSLSPDAQAAVKYRERIILFTTSCWLIFFSIWGALARIGLSKLTAYPGSPLSGVVWANFAGCVVMGFMSEEIRLFGTRKSGAPGTEEAKEEEDPHWGTNKKIVPLYIGITTGFCGSLTSFSTWMRDIFFAMSNTQPAYLRHRGYNVEAILAEVIMTLCLSIAALSFGAHLAILLRSVLRSIPVHWRPVIDRLGMILGPACWLGVVFMSVFIAKWRGTALFAGVFAPLGAWTRFMLSKKLNPLVASFPVGTFTVNVAGTIILAVGLVAQSDGVSLTGCQIWQGIDDGFCGALTTVSTFVVELKGMRRKHSYIYGGVTIVAGICLMVLILGAFTWAHGLEVKRC